MLNPSYWALFLSAFISSTLMPGGSEAVLVYLSRQAEAHGLALVLVATVGNTLGAMTSWGIGRVLAWRFPARQWSARHQQAMARLQHWGPAVLLLSWLPVIGDPLCVAAGWLRLPWAWVLVFIAAGKLGRYMVVLWVFGAD